MERFLSLTVGLMKITLHSKRKCVFVSTSHSCSDLQNRQYLSNLSVLLTLSASICKLWKRSRIFAKLFPKEWLCKISRHALNLKFVSKDANALIFCSPICVDLGYIPSWQFQMHIKFWVSCNCNYLQYLYHKEQRVNKSSWPSYHSLHQHP